jgi:hypothetical protein
MKVLSVLRKAGLITSDDESEAREDRSGGASGGGKGSREAGSSASQTLPPPPDEAALAPLGASELVVDFDQIFAALKIPTPEHGWTVEKVQKALASPHFTTLDDATRKAALLAMLGASNAPASDIVDDAIRRDQGLDAYERFARKKQQERLAGITERIAQEEARIGEAQRAIAELKQTVSKEEAAFRTWLARKTAKEEELAGVVALLTSDSKISIGETKSETAPPGPERKGEKS